jgi:hypothetical protein
MGRRGNLTVAGIALGVAAVAAAVIVAVALRGSQAPSQTSAAVGEVIYRTGTFNGQPIARTGGPAGGMMGGGMMGAAGCAGCHGLDGQGRTAATFTAPNITYSNLTDPKGMLAPDGSRGPTYTDATLRRAVTTGIDPTGDHLAAPMPQWQLTNQEWADLLAYLKTLR